MRWEHPERGLLTPGAFLPAFDDAELALKLGERLMECVLADFQQLEAQGSPPPTSQSMSRAWSRGFPISPNACSTSSPPAACRPRGCVSS